jgi:hypothetical protein
VLLAGVAREGKPVLAIRPLSLSGVRISDGSDLEGVFDGPTSTGLDPDERLPERQPCSSGAARR